MQNLQTRQEWFQRLKGLQLDVEYIQDDYLPIADIYYGDMEHFQFLYQYSHTPHFYPTGLVSWGDNESNALIMTQMSIIFYDLFVMIECVELTPKSLLLYAGDYTPQYHVEMQWIQSIGFPLWYGLEKLEKPLYQAYLTYYRNRG